MLDFFSYWIWVILHLDTSLLYLVSHYGIWIYLILALVIFSETALIIFPFLPGDSLLFASGSIAANSNHSLNIVILSILLVTASFVGNQVNYLIGRKAGPKLLSNKQSKWFNQKYLLETHQFYEKHGGKTIIIARFMPIIRTFAPFVAGIGTMPISHFIYYNLVSAILWIGSLLFFGYFFGSLPFFQQHFNAVIYGIIIVSLLPPILSYVVHKVKKTALGRAKPLD